MNDLDQTTQYFANSILQLPEFARFQKAAEKLENDKDALRTLQDVQERIQAISTLQQSGLPVSETQRQELSSAQAKLRSNEVCMEYLKSQNVATTTARKICNNLTAATGITFAAGGGCCG